jgi:hypothetical protein
MARPPHTQFVLDGQALVLGVDGIADFNDLHSRKHDDEVQLLRFRHSGAQRRRLAQPATVDAQDQSRPAAAMLMQAAEGGAPVMLAEIEIRRALNADGSTEGRQSDGGSEPGRTGLSDEDGLSLC